MKIRIYLKSFLKNSIEESLMLFSSFLISCDKLSFCSVSLPTKIKKFCVLRSPHIDKDSREEFEIRIYKRFFDVNCENIAPISKMLESINLPSGVAVFIRFL